jgi:uridine kinase
MESIRKLCGIISKQFHDHHTHHTFTVAISGIDASGKGYLAKHLEDELKKQGLIVANINVDPWQNPIAVRLQRENPAENFYHNVFRWNDIFYKLIIPLRKDGHIKTTCRLIHSHADVYFDHTFDYNKLDILILEGIFLFQEKFVPYYDFKVWVDCSFDVGLKRALKRNVEKLDEMQLRHDYATYYYPAQRYHFEKDKPLLKADYIYHSNEE